VHVALGAGHPRPIALLEIVVTSLAPLSLSVKRLRRVEITRLPALVEAIVTIGQLVYMMRVYAFAFVTAKGAPRVHRQIEYGGRCVHPQELPSNVLDGPPAQGV
jgi:uncharacterized membrane protein YhaH (DUF805 family)